MNLKTTNFLNELFEYHNIPNVYKTLRYDFNNAIVYNKNQNNVDLNKKKISILVYIAFPKFLNPTFDYQYNFKSKKIIQKKQDSFGIVINDNIESIDQYLDGHFNKKSRTTILNRKKRLENCFHITYNVFFGHIEKDTYDKVMMLTHSMLTRRFIQKNDDNFVLKNWEKYLKMVFYLINHKRASIFVINNGSEPIQVSINFHFEKIFFAYILAYNIDYAKFGLGNIGIYKRLEWCIENNYEYLDMGNGDLEHKKKWCNYHYELETHIIYKNSLKANILAFKEFNTIKIKNIVKDAMNSLLYNKIKQIVSANKSKYSAMDYLNYTTENLKETASYKSEQLQVINLKSTKKFEDLKKLLIDFLYNTKEHMDNVIIYKLKNEKEAFLIKGSINSIKVTFNEKN